ncbi:hypothetical protein CEXT_349171 [Caerostris extrusa]|uniref:Secreted protein n=1 Tax=Caerostris extrusa TaxID=172846 RepID=A0AAV4S1I1_CAEEX|nr:hypothetical protein CEXT_349171 [Caerostris extrusa]
MVWCVVCNSVVLATLWVIIPTMLPIIVQSLNCTDKADGVLKNGNLLSVVCAPEIRNPIWVTQKKLSGRESCPRAYFALVGSYAKPLALLNEDSAA